MLSLLRGKRPSVTVCPPPPLRRPGPPPDAYQAYITESSVACLLAVYYTLQTARTKDRVGLMRVLGCLSTSEGDRAFDDTFLHSLVRRRRL